MTLSASDITSRLSDFRRQVHNFEQIANEISSGPYSKEKIAKTRSEYAHFHDEVTSFEEYLQNIASKLIDPFLNAMSSQYVHLLEDCEHLGEKLDKSYTTNKITYKLDRLFERYLIPEVSQGKLQLGCIEKLKEKNLKIVLTLELTPSQLEKAMKFHETLQRHQEYAVSKLLKKLDATIEKAIHYPEDDQTRFRKLTEINFNLGRFQLGRDARNNIFEKLWVEAGKPQWQGELWVWGIYYLENHLPRFRELISSHPFYNRDIAEIMESMNSSSEEEDFVSDDALEGIEKMQIPSESLIEVTMDSIAENNSENDNLPDAAKTQFPFSDYLEAVVDEDISEPEDERYAQVSNLDRLFSLETAIDEILCIPDFSREQRIDAINAERRHLPEELRCLLDGKFYELSNDPNKGGEGWGDKHAAEDPGCLLEAIEELKKKFV